MLPLHALGSVTVGCCLQNETSRVEKSQLQERELGLGRMLELIVKPDDVRFTQDSIAIKFKYPYDYLRIDDAVEQIQKGLLTATDFNPMNVVRHNGILWSLDNRRLWVFRKAQVQQVTVNIVSSSYSERSQMFFMNLDAQSERAYSSPSFYPRVRGRVKISILNPVRVPSTVSPASSQRAAVPPPSPYKPALVGQSTSTSPSWNTHRPVPVHTSSSAGSWGYQGVPRPASSYTGSHSRDSNSAMNDNIEVSFFGILKKVLGYFFGQ